MRVHGVDPLGPLLPPPIPPSRASIHWKPFYSLQLITGRVWNYTGDSYAHRALRGHMSPSQEGVHRGLREGGRQGYNGLRRVTGGELGAAEGAGRDLDSASPLHSTVQYFDNLLSSVYLSIHIHTLCIPLDRWQTTKPLDRQPVTAKNRGHKNISPVFG